MKVILRGIHQTVREIHHNFDQVLPRRWENTVVLQFGEREWRPDQIIQYWLGTCPRAECAASEIHGCDRIVNRGFEVVGHAEVYPCIGREANQCNVVNSIVEVIDESWDGSLKRRSSTIRAH